MKKRTADRNTVLTTLTKTDISERLFGSLPKLLQVGDIITLHLACPPADPRESELDSEWPFTVLSHRANSECFVSVDCDLYTVTSFGLPPQPLQLAIIDNNKREGAYLQMEPIFTDSWTPVVVVTREDSWVKEFKRKNKV